MATDRIAKFYKFLDEGLAREGEFISRPFYNHDADVLFFYARDVPSYAKRFSSSITIILSSEDDSLVGIKLKSVKRLLATLKRLDVCVIDTKIKLGILLAVARAAPPEVPDLEPKLDELDEYQDIEISKEELCAAC